MIEGSAGNKQAHLVTSSATTLCSYPSLQLWIGLDAVPRQYGSSVDHHLHKFTTVSGRSAVVCSLSICALGGQVSGTCRGCLAAPVAEPIALSVLAINQNKAVLGEAAHRACRQALFAAGLFQSTSAPRDQLPCACSLFDATFKSRVRSGPFRQSCHF